MTGKIGGRQSILITGIEGTVARRDFELRRKLAAGQLAGFV